jgi:hypothetical protein
MGGHTLPDPALCRVVGSVLPPIGRGSTGDRRPILEAGSETWTRLQVYLCSLWGA